MREPNLLSLTKSINERLSNVSVASITSHGESTESSNPKITASIMKPIDQKTYHYINDVIAQQIDKRIQQLIREAIDQIMIIMLAEMSPQVLSNAELRSIKNA